MDRVCDEGTGCGSAILAYLIGSYVVALVAQLAGWSSVYLLAAPVSLPVLFALGVVLIGNREIPVDPYWLLAAGSVWCATVVGCWGLLRSWHSRRLRLWPIVLLAGGVLLALAMLLSR